MNSIPTWAILLIAKNQSSDSVIHVDAVKYNFSYKSSWNQYWTTGPEVNCNFIVVYHLLREFFVEHVHIQ